MARPDANRIALRASRAILDAATPFQVEIGDATIAITPERLPDAPWPARRLDGITEEADGPWPAAVDLRCEWAVGSCLLRLAASTWRPRSRESDQVSLWISAPEVGHDLLWITVANQIRDVRDGEEFHLFANPSVVSRAREYAGIREHLNRVIRELVQTSGLPMLSAGRIDAFGVRIPAGDVLPSPADAFRTLVHLTLIKLPFFELSGLRAIHGRSYIDADAIAEHARAVLRDKGALISSGKHTILSRMPGGYREYKAPFDRILQFVAERAPSLADMDRFVEEDLELSNSNRRKRIVRLITRLGLLEDTDGVVELTDAGHAYLADRSEAALFRLLHHTYEGMLATLVIADRAGGADNDNTLQLLGTLCDLPSLGQTQANARRDWLTSLGLTERISGTDQITTAGRTVLAEYPDEADELAARLEGLLAAPVVDAAPESDDGPDDGEDGDGLVPPDQHERPEPPSWAHDRLVLRVKDVTKRMERLALPDGLVERICAALTAGKHLLFVGPPGTGKTEIANALARAAQDQGYCSGLFVATASADWTTYETIGGYAMLRSGELRFRPGAFLRAVEFYQWLLIDELNRADVDKAFGELMTVLSGKSTDTPFERDDGRHISIGPDERHTHQVPGTFRVLGTMNTWDKTSLFRLSYAVQRRFAIIHVGVPTPERYAALLERDATVESDVPPLEAAALRQLQQLFTPEKLLGHRAIGPAVALDMVKYLRYRQGGGDGLAEALAMYLLPQLEGIESDAAERVWDELRGTLADWTSDESLAELRERYQELFPHVELAE